MCLSRDTHLSSKGAFIKYVGEGFGGFCKFFKKITTIKENLFQENSLSALQQSIN